MNKNLIIGLGALVVIALLALIIPPQLEARALKAKRAHFIELANPVPHWWDNVEPVIPNIASRDQLMKAWRSEKHCCTQEDAEPGNRRFFKAALLAAIEHIDNPDIFVPAIDLLDLSYTDYEKITEVNDYVLEHHFFFEKKTDECTNCMAGDRIANIVVSQHSHYASQDRLDEYIPLTQKFIRERGIVTSDYVLSRVYQMQAYAYNKTGDTKSAITVLEKALKDFAPEFTNDTGAMRNNRKAMERMLKGYQNKK